jgi:uncharacterized SAM-binding protein YcdF (DUF218 family)
LIAMIETRTNPGSGGSGRVGSQPRKPAPLAWLRSLARAAIAIGLVCAVVIGVGFWRFATRLPADEVVLDRNADGIVVLTGGASRISDAIELLAAGRGHRLLISGLNRATTAEEISRLNPEFGPLMGCCIDFDRSLNTLGNAIETRHWAESHGFHSLIVVTSNYHMPRAMAEIGHQLPGVALLPFPVVTDRERSESWWVRGPMLKLMLSEYFKYMYARMRIRLDPTAGQRAA